MKKTINPYDVVLDDEEQEIENLLDFAEIKKTENAQTKMASLKKAATQYLRKDKQINIRISSSDLLRLKEAAADEGLPYQTLIASVLHKYAVGQTVHR